MHTRVHHCVVLVLYNVASCLDKDSIRVEIFVAIMTGTSPLS